VLIEDDAATLTRRTHRYMASDRNLLGVEAIYPEIKNPPGSPTEFDEQPARTGVPYTEEAGEDSKEE